MADKKIVVIRIFPCLKRRMTMNWKGLQEGEQKEVGKIHRGFRGLHMPYICGKGAQDRTKQLFIQGYR